MKKHILSILSLSLFCYGSALACGGDFYEEDFYASKAFNQETTEEQEFFPFLRTYNFSYEKATIKVNQNCNDWASYFGISPEQAYYLVTKSSKTSLEQLIQSGKATDPNLKFANKSFCKAKKDGLTYLAFAKYLEPYMDTKETNSYDLWEYRYYEKPLNELKYDETLESLINAYKSQTDNQLKMRYGYQIVRLAHYKKHYREAIQYFDQYVESLKIKPEIYYYALSQKAGALDALQNKCRNCEPVNAPKDQAIFDFLKVFNESKDLKFAAYNSLRFCSKGMGLKRAFMIEKQSVKEACNTYFLLAYNNFNNPINELDKIVKFDANAPQAKVLMARFINEVETSSNLYNRWEAPKSARTFLNNIDEAIRIAESQTQNAQNKNFWNLATAFLHTYCLDYGKAKSYLSKVNGSNDLFKSQKDLLSTIIDIVEPTTFSEELANKLFEKHENRFSEPIITELMVRRLGEINAKGKQRLLTSGIGGEEIDPQIWEEIIALAKKSSKSKFEKWLLEKDGEVDLKELNNHLGMSYFYNGNIEKANSLVTSSDINLNAKCAFCYTIGHIIYNGSEDESTFYNDYIQEIMGNVSFENINFKDALSHLSKLLKQSEGSGDKAAKASFLLGNFYYNFGSKGYYRWRIAYSGEYGTVATKYYSEALNKVSNDLELKAKILFALAKATEEGDRNKYQHGEILPYFRSLNELTQTAFRQQALSKCLYFADYVNGN